MLAMPDCQGRLTGLVPAAAQKGPQCCLFSTCFVTLHHPESEHTVQHHNCSTKKKANLQKPLGKGWLSRRPKLP